MELQWAQDCFSQRIDLGAGCVVGRREARRAERRKRKRASRPWEVVMPKARIRRIKRVRKAGEMRDVNSSVRSVACMLVA